MRAGGPRSQGSFHASVQPGAPVRLRCANAREQGTPSGLAGDAGRRPVLPERQSNSRKDSSAMRAARKIARPLFMLSFHSRRAIESATTPPPACM